MKKIILLGYMASGKSEIGKNLAKKLEIPFFDLDILIENELKMSISEIFSIKSEIYFRKIESEIFNLYLQKNEQFVLSLGGGTPCYANNHLQLNNTNVNSIYLQASVDTLVGRLKTEKNSRPILAQKNENELKNYIAQHIFERSYFYNFAQNKINVNNKSVAEITLEIEQLL